MFGRNQIRRRSGVGIIRFFLSLIILGFLAIGLYVAYRSFSAADPLNLNPILIGKAILNDKKIPDFITGLLTINPQNPLQGVKRILSTKDIQPSPKTSALKFRFAVVADSHKDTQNLKKALQQLKNNGAKFVIGMGDFSDVGTLEELQNTKNVFDSIDLPYYSTAGDHDLWDSRNKKSDPVKNFKDVFGPPYQSFSFQNVRFLIIYNSDNYQGLDDVQLSWLENELQRIFQESPKLFFVFTPTPLYHPSSDHVMGKVDLKLKNQADHLLSLFKKHQANEIFAGDTHLFSRYKDPVDNLNMVTVGAITSERNPQSPRYAEIDVFEDGGYNVKEVEVQ